MVICLYGGNISPYLGELVGGKSVLDRVKAYVNEVQKSCGQPGDSRVVAFCHPDTPSLPDEWTRIERENWCYPDLVGGIADQVDGPDSEVLLAYLDQPFQNCELAGRIVDKHRRYRADYTFCDGYPKGLGCEVVAGRAVSHLVELSAGVTDPIERDGLFPVIQKDINRLDVETELCQQDLRMLRLSLSADTRANLALCQSLAPGAPEEIDGWIDHVTADQERHRSLPTFAAVQVIEQEVQRVSYSPYPQMIEDVLAPGRVMETKLFASIVAQLNDLSPEAHVLMSIWGEVALHPEFRALASAVLDTPHLKLVIETSGVGWSEDDQEFLFGLEQDRLILLIGLDTNDADLYQEIRGDGYAESQAFAHQAVERLPRSAFVQATRYESTEPQLEPFYRYWKEKTSNIAIQKYDHFCGSLKALRIGDISPIDRFPCWHLRRDLNILVDGTVTLCRDDIQGEHVLGKCEGGGLQQAWEAGAEAYRRHVSGDYPALCAQCDEYYTFNF